MKKLLMILPVFLLCSCATLTPDQTAILAKLAADAVQAGLQLLLTQRPEERTNVVAVVDAMKVITDVGPMSSRQTASLMRGLPESALKGDTAEIYVSGKRGSAKGSHLVIYDNLRGKAFTVPDGVAGEAVSRAVRQGMERALAPMPPLPIMNPRSGRNYQLATNTLTISKSLGHALTVSRDGVTNLSGLYTHNPAFAREMALPLPVMESPTPAVPSGKSSPRVGIYRVERKDGTNWAEVSSFTSGLGEMRVRRVR